MSVVQIGGDDVEWADEDWDDEDWAEQDFGDQEGADQEQASTDAVTGLRLVLSDAYADASDAEMADALGAVLGAMSPAEAFDFGKALRQVARGAGQAFSDPAVASIARTVLPAAGGVLGTAVGGPVGTMIGGQLGAMAANALPAPRRAGTARTPAAPPPGAPPAPPAVAVRAPAAAAGSTSAAQALVLSGNDLMRQALAAAAMGQHGQQQVAGIPVAQLLGLLGRLAGQAAAEADELRYLTGTHHDDGDLASEDESEVTELSSDWAQELYTRVIDADNLDLAESLDLPEMTS